MRVLFYLLLLLTPLSCFPEAKKAITFGWGGRLGDNILDYTHAKWISYKWDIPLLFQPFEYSDQFAFHDLEEQLTPEKQAQYTVKILSSFSQLDEKVNEDTLYFLGHTCDSFVEYRSLGSYGLYVPVDWTDEIFLQMMRTFIYPRDPIQTISPPKNIISVALHFRNGGGFMFDTPNMKKSLPLRFPEPMYYVEQLKKLHQLVNQQPLYVHIFTDFPEPMKIKKLFQHFFPSPCNITFSCRETENRHNANVLEDLFSMVNFDCLIRPMSHYSMTASHLGNFKIEIFPRHGSWVKNLFVVDQVDIIENGKWDPLLKMWK